MTSDIEMSYAQAVRSSSYEGSKVVASRSSLEKSLDDKIGGRSLAGSKRPRYQKDATCGRCFRSLHKTTD